MPSVFFFKPAAWWVRWGKGAVRIAAVTALVLQCWGLRVAIASSGDSEPTFRFNIPSQRADKALTTFATTAGVTLVVPFDSTSRVRANDLYGEWSVRDGLQRLLAGTGLKINFKSATQITIDSTDQQSRDSTNMKKHATGLLALLVGVFTNQTYAQSDSATNASADVAPLAEVIVTARKRDETLHDVPLSISVFTAKNLQDIGAFNLEDVAKRTPGFQYSAQGNTEPGRGTTVLRFRGMHGPSELATPFIDGIPVMGGIAGIGLEDVERIEVIKGPQSAFFGRATFGGAVNFITRNPNDKEYKGQLSTKVAQQGLYDISLSHEGPIIPGKLSYRVTGRTYHTDGPYRSVADQGKLGEESTNALQVTLRATPTDNLTARARVMVYTDADGVPAGGFIGGNLLTCYAKNGGPLFTPPPGYTGVGPVDYFCGALPMVPNSRVSNNTTIPPRAQDLFIGHNNPLYHGTVFDDLPSLGRMGLKRESLRTSLAIDYTFPSSGWVLSSNTGYDDESVARNVDFDATIAPDYYGATGSTLEDFFQELRLASSSEGRLTWLLGLSYYEQHTRIPGSVTWQQTLNAVFSEAGLDNKVKTPAVFGSLGYRFTDKVNISLEGRYQKDKIKKRSSNSGIAMEATFTNFAPRVILQYHPVESTNLYITYAKGNKPGDFNSSVLALNDAERQQVVSQTGGGNTVPEEKLTNHELGWKQFWLDNRLSTNFAAYYMKWKNQQTSVPAVIYNPAHPNANPAGFRPIQLLIAAGKTDLRGVEAEATFRVNPNFETGLTFDWADSEYKLFTCGFVQRFTGSTNCAGNQSPRFPEFSGSAYVRYSRPIATDWTGFIRGEAVYFGRAFIDESNLGWTKPYTTVQLRAGAEKESLRLEFWVNNLFDEDFYVAAARATNFTNLFNFSQQGANLTPGLGRQGGVTVVYEF